MINSSDDCENKETDYICKGFKQIKWLFPAASMQDTRAQRAESCSWEDKQRKENIGKTIHKTSSLI